MSVKCPHCRDKFKDARGALQHIKKTSSHRIRFPRLWETKFAARVKAIVSNADFSNVKKVRDIQTLIEVNG